MWNRIRSAPWGKSAQLFESLTKNIRCWIILAFRQIHVVIAATVRLIVPRDLLLPKGLQMFQGFQKCRKNCLFRY